MSLKTSKINKLSKEISLVTLKQVSKFYGNKSAVNKVDFEIKQGDRIGVIGANGSGKSTLSEIIGGIRQPSSGTINRKEKLILGLQFQESRYPIGISVIDMIKYYLHTFSIAMKQSELETLLNTYQLKGLENKFIQSLSGGQQQRLNILLAIIHDPDLVILDEISTGLDIEIRMEIFTFLQKNIVEKNKAMLLVSHEFSEIEDLCEKFIYMHNGEILASGMVKDVVKEHGSVHNYAYLMLKKHKEADKQSKIVSNKNHLKLQKKDKIVSDGHNYGKNLPLINLMLKYYYKGFFVPFFLLAYPIIILFLQGFAFKNATPSGQEPWFYLHSLIGSISIVQAISVGIFVIPQTILEFKNSVLMKRIGATNIRPLLFVVSVVVIGFIFIVIAILWTVLWAGIMFGHEFGWRTIAMPQDLLPALPFLAIIIATSISMGMALSPMFNSSTSFIAIANVIYLPISFLSGGFIPVELIEKSEILKYVTYINPFKYSLDPFLNAWNQKFIFDSVYYIYIPISLLLIILMVGFAGWKLRWQK